MTRTKELALTPVEPDQGADDPGSWTDGPRAAPRASGIRPRDAANPLEVAGVHRAFKGRGEVLKGLSFTAQEGDRIALTGPNGSGKSTLLRCIAGSMKPTAGTITVYDHPAGSVAARDLIGVSLSQERSFYLRLTCEQNLAYFANLRRDLPDRAKDHVKAIVKEIAIEDFARQRVDRCSTGMVQQLTFARALLGDPKVLLLDEPTRSLDKNAVERLWAALDRRPECIVVIATHREEDVARCGTHIDLT